MSVRATNWAWDQPCGRPAKLVLLALADRADEEGVCWPSRRWLSQKCAPMSVESIGRALTQLVEEGLIVKEERLRRDDQTFGPWKVRLQLASGQKSPLEPVGRSDHAEPKNPSVPTDVGTVDEPVGESDHRLDPVWEALVARFGAAPAGSARKLWNRVRNDLTKDGWDGSDLPALEGVYRRLYPDAALTPLALAKHYTMLRHELDGKKSRAVTCEECGIGGGLHLAECSKAKEVAA